MDLRKIVTTVVLVTAVVFAWSVVMAAMGHVSFVAWLAPALALTVQQIVRTTRSRNAPTSGQGTVGVSDKEDAAP
ncbi:hypothetical protein [Streptomyces sp. NPDC048612]|uniref:hypothetical protein n=1 Tax=Streptomyces sp. NPDC048612 TaxID=3365579 RepID=UPI00372292A4